MERDELFTQIMDVLDGMPYPLRHAFILHRYRGKSVDEIGAELGVSSLRAQELLDKAALCFEQQLKTARTGVETAAGLSACGCS